MSQSKISISENLFDFNEMNNKSIKLFHCLIDSSELSGKESGNNAKKYYLLCSCGKIPSIQLFENGIIYYLCNNCKKSLIINSIEKIFDLLFLSDEKDIKNLKCIEHNEKYTFFYNKKYQSSSDETPKKKNFCRICMNEHSEQKVIYFGRDAKTNDKSNYIYNVINKDEVFEYTEKSFDSENNTAPERNTSSESENSDSENIEINAGDTIIKLNENNNDVGENEIKQLSNVIDQLVKKKELYDRLFKIIIENHKNYPNYEYRKIISNIEKFVTVRYKEYNEIKLKYKFNEDDIIDSKIKLFGEIFVNNNKENCFLIIKGKLLNLKKKFELKKIFGEEEINYPFILEVKLIERQRKTMHDFSFMFNEIFTILPDSSFEKYDSNNIRSMKNMFYNCKTLKNLPDISILDTKNVENMSNMFYNCSSLKQLPDISKWNTANLINANSMFENCSSLSISSFPDISRWNIKKILYMNNMFKNCKLLKNLPSFLNWDINTRTEISDMYYEINEIESIDNNFSKKEKNIILRTLFSIVNNCFNLFINLIDFFERQSSKNILLFIKTIFSLIFPLIFLYGIFILENNKEEINNPIEYYNSINTTDIKYIKQCLKIYNSSIINENKEQYIKTLLNFTSINGNITFASSLKKYGLYNSLIVIILYIEIICALYIFSELEKKAGNYKNVISIIMLTFFLLIISGILNILDIGLISNIFASINSFRYKAYKIFKNKYLNDTSENYFLLILIPSKIWDLYFWYTLIKFFLRKYTIIRHKKEDWNKIENFLLKRKNRINLKKIYLIFCKLIEDIFK